MGDTTTDSPVLRRVRELVETIASDLQLDLYDVERRGGTVRVTLDTQPGSSTSVDLDQLALATRLISRELDHTDPVPGKYTLEVTSPGVERTLRTPAHFRREVGKTISVRLANVDADERRLEGVLVAADDTTATIRPAAADDATAADPDADGIESSDRVIALADIDRARTVFVWGPQPKKGGKHNKGGKSKSGTKPKSGTKSNGTHQSAAGSKQNRKESS